MFVFLGYLMFLQELFFVCEEASKQPVAFVGGFVAGVLRLDIHDEPLSSWLKQGIGNGE